MNIIYKYLDYSIIDEDNVGVFPCNSVVKSNGELVMGAGNAKAVKEAFPEVPLVMGSAYLDKPELSTIMAKQFSSNEFKKAEWDDLVYGNKFLMTIQTIKSPISLLVTSLLEDSLRCFKDLAESLEFTIKKDLTFHIPMPAVGKGGLEFKKVKSLINEIGFGSNFIFYYGGKL